MERERRREKRSRRSQSTEPGLRGTARLGRRSGGMRRCRGAGLPALAALLIVAAVRGQLQQEPFLEIVEGTSISIKCSHPNIKTGDFIYFYRQLPGQSPELLAMTTKAPKEVRAPKGRMSVSADRRSSALWLAGPRRGDAAVYYCALGATARGAGAAAGHEPPWAGPAGASRGRCRSALPGRGSAAPSSAPSPPHRQRTATHGPQAARNLRSHSPHTQPGLPSLPSPTLPHTELLRAAPLPAPLALRPRLLLLLSACFAKHRAAP
ncbi:uncharacterized protein LOC108963618 [Serinus canaria]|uniref:uncharacterized protein LOC108963618 n=1 Tax=Serinus canaria TaxID=9135 RepID=UPI0021CC9B7E|nr:uncharacterized protein LOC108963618 [Serinus canaria]